MAEDPGYLILEGQLPDPKLLKDAKAEAKAPSNDTSPLGFEILGWGENCSALFHKGLDLPGNAFLTERLQKPYDQANSKIHMAQTVHWMKNSTQLKRLRAGRGRVFIYRAIEEELGPQNGFFRIVKGSHRMNVEEILNTKAEDIHLKPGQVIVVDGDLVIEYPSSGGGSGLLIAIHKN